MSLPEEIALALEDGMHVAGAMEWDNNLAVGIIRNMLHNYYVKPIVRESCEKCGGSGQYRWAEYATRCGKCCGQGWLGARND